jgi:hypothetical protein
MDLDMEEVLDSMLPAARFVWRVVPHRHLAGAMD